MLSEKCLYNLTNEKSDNPLFHGIIYTKGYVYATNGVMFAKVKYENPKEWKNKIVYFDGKVSSYDDVDFAKKCYAIEDYIKAKERDTVDLLRISSVIIPFIDMVAEETKRRIFYVRIGDCYFRTYYLRRFCSVADEMFLYQAGMSRKKMRTALVSYDTDGCILLASDYADKADNQAYMDYKNGEIHNFEYDINALFNICRADIEKKKGEINNLKNAKEKKILENDILRREEILCGVEKLFVK